MAAASPVLPAPPRSAGLATLAGLLDDASLSRLAGLAASPPTGTVVVLEAPAGDAGMAAATALAPLLLADPEAALRDVRAAAPAGDRWTVAELDLMVIAPAALAPIERTVVAVASAAAMDVRAAEHLLKVLEEPPSPAVFLLVVHRAGDLLATIRGRASAVVRLELADPPTRTAQLVAGGLDAALAAEVVDLCGNNVALAVAVASAGDPSAAVADLRAAFGPGVPATAPTTWALSTLGCLERLSALVAPAAEAKPALRSMVRHLVAAQRSGLHARVRAASTAREWAAVDTALAALGAAERELGAYASPLAVLAALRSRTAAA